MTANVDYYIFFDEDFKVLAEVGLHDDAAAYHYGRQLNDQHKKKVIVCKKIVEWDYFDLSEIREKLSG